HGVAIDLRRMQVQEDVGKNRQRAIARIGAIVGNAKDRLPELRVLRVFVVFRFLFGAFCERARAFPDALDESLVGFLAGRELLLFVWVWRIVHDLPHTLMNAPSSSKWPFSPLGH